MNDDEGVASGPVALWQELSRYLTMTVDAEVPSNAQHDTETVVTLVLENTARVHPDWPAIVFDDISIDVMPERSPQSSSRDGAEKPLSFNLRTHGLALQTGESLSQKYPFTKGELADVEFSIRSTISRRAFFHLERSEKIPLTHTRETVLSFLKTYNEIEIHGALESGLLSISLPGKQT